MPPIKKRKMFRFFFETLKKFRQQKKQKQKTLAQTRSPGKSKGLKCNNTLTHDWTKYRLVLFFSQGSDILFGDKERFFRALFFFFFFFFMQLEIVAILVGRLQFTESSAVKKSETKKNCSTAVCVSSVVSAILKSLLQLSSSCKKLSH